VRTRRAEIARQRNLIGINQEKLALSQTEYDRLKSLFDAGGIAWIEVKAVELALRRTQEEVERAESGLREAEAQLAVAEAEVASAEAERLRAREALADTRVRAPFAGIITRKSVTLGEQVAPGTILVRLADIGTVKLVIRIPADDVASLRIGAEAEITVAAFPQPLTGRVAYLGPGADAETRTFPVEILVENRGPRPLLPGMFARATVAVRTYPQAVLIPRSSLLSADGVPGVFVAEAGTGLARRRPVAVERAFGSRLLVAEGLAAGDLLIVVGHRLLTEGAAIRVVETREQAR
jgi:RND family efflux transporter MFP subunit